MLGSGKKKLTSYILNEEEKEKKTIIQEQSSEIHYINHMRWLNMLKAKRKVKEIGLVSAREH